MSSSSSDYPSAPFHAALIIGCAFFYFLIFAQFGFLHRLQSIEARSNLIEIALGAMGLGGILGSAFAGRRFEIRSARNWLVAGFVGCGLSAIGSLLATSIWTQSLIAFSVGGLLGSLTVSIVPLLRAMSPRTSIGFWAGTGVGGAYFLSNIPPLFHSSADNHCLFGAICCCAGACLSLMLPPIKATALTEESPFEKTPHSYYRSSGTLLFAAFFFVLIWLDSAAFFLIQSSDALKSASWSTPAQLWANAFIHLLAALLAGWMLDRGRIFSVLVYSILLLGLGYVFLSLLEAPPSLAPRLYVTGVSLYSTSLVAYGALAPESETTWSIRARAGLVFAFGGWVGSGLGIGMARDLGRVPTGFLVAALAFTGVCSLARRKLEQNQSSTEESAHES